MARRGRRAMRAKKIAQKRSNAAFVIFTIIAIFALGSILLTVAAIVGIVLLFVGTLFIAVKLVMRIYAHFYFKGWLFYVTKQKIDIYVQDCNALNQHILDLRNSFSIIHKTDFGDAQYNNTSTYNYSKKKSNYAPNVYPCSRQVCDTARKYPFKQICKYFNVEINETTLEQFESALNNFASAEEGKVLSARKRDQIMQYVNNVTPWIIKKYFAQRLDEELGFKEFEFDEIYFPTYSFRYESSGGRSSDNVDVVMNLEMMERFINFLSEQIKFRESALGQRRLMTPKLRREIITRDNFTCRYCGNSTYNEPNLLLEVDHIIPVAKGGLTTEENLQTLCWKCNRSKSSKIVA